MATVNLYYTTGVESGGNYRSILTTNSNQSYKYSNQLIAYDLPTINPTVTGEEETDFGVTTCTEATITLNNGWVPTWIKLADTANGAIAIFLLTTSLGTTTYTVIYSQNCSPSVTSVSIGSTTTIALNIGGQLYITGVELFNWLHFVPDGQRLAVTSLSDNIYVDNSNSQLIRLPYFTKSGTVSKTTTFYGCIPESVITSWGVGQTISINSSILSMISVGSFPFSVDGLWIYTISEPGRNTLVTDGSNVITSGNNIVVTNGFKITDNNISWNKNEYVLLHAARFLPEEDSDADKLKWKAIYDGSTVYIWEDRQGYHIEEVDKNDILNGTYNLLASTESDRSGVLANLLFFAKVPKAWQFQLPQNA